MPSPQERRIGVNVARRQAREALNAVTREADFQATVMAVAQLHGWRVLHINDSRRQAGGAFVGDADVKGFPDLLMLRGERICVVELKSDTGRLTPEQEDWLAHWSLTPAETYVWRPSTPWEHIEAALR